MAWPKGVKRGPRVIAQESVQAATEASPIPAAIQSETTAPRSSVAKARMGGSSAGSKPKWEMKAGSNWDTWDGSASSSENPDQFHIPKEDFPEGMDMQWVTETVYGQDIGRLPKFQRYHWTPVHTEDFGGRFNNRWVANDYIRKDGMVLVARPKEISDMARARDMKAAKEQLALKAQAFAGGQISATGADHPTALATNKISRSIERIDIPTE